jgi:small subunit ribosomal protein S8
MSYLATDPMADMLTRIRNAIAVGRSELVLPHSKSKAAVAELLKSHGFINDVKVSSDKVGKTIAITVNLPNENAKITEITRISRPGRRTYAGINQIPVVKNGRGIVIVSTSKGLLTGKQAKELGVGGELICKVY